jgi:hypothetical protein
MSHKKIKLDDSIVKNYIRVKEKIFETEKEDNIAAYLYATSIIDSKITN